MDVPSGCIVKGLYW